MIKILFHWMTKDKPESFAASMKALIVSLIVISVIWLLFVQ